MKRLLGYAIFTVYCIFILVLSIRGIPGNPAEKTLNDPRWGEEGPFELSPERGRFALLVSLIENKSFHFSLPIARFAIPDLGYTQGNYVSLFAPGLSIISIPGYLIGKYYNNSQIGTYAVVSLFAVLNAILIRALAQRAGSTSIASSLAALVFLFATPAYAYAVSFYQHHLSTFLILISIYLLITLKGVLPLYLLWILFGIALITDYPNVILMLPILLFALKNLIYLVNDNGKTIVNVRILGFISLITILIPLFFLFWFNQNSYGNPMSLAGTVTAVKSIDKSGRPELPKVAGGQKTAVGFFKSRNMFNGINILLFSPDRGLFIYTPVVLFSLFGIWAAYKKNLYLYPLFTALISINILLYSMWGDPWGGWAFGSRYLIPGFAIASIFIAIALTRYHRNIIFFLIFFITLSYSLAINTLGALTSNRNPPLSEIKALEKLSGKAEKYTYERNLDLLLNGVSKSYLFQSYGSKFFSPVEYYRLIVFMLAAVCFFLIVADNLSIFKNYHMEKRGWQKLIIYKKQPTKYQLSHLVNLFFIKIMKPI
ncbi:MAG: hypothetical protein UV73_C0003G0051 [Candidatus Gottesmanbacteria bacterium GW2011_GWA2_43_14]|uniref:Glycosyltransferase RgtA/B/C/D-like domain-containing protein n=1 Tax=Candidatus Gottesmanbacteria bacterium GW2011_GWA2_43_14 TaxID=1618443 RepID=A0A0G1DKE9_9BACT|nr:MAG: hypothetical protein UV73_C0003G0051 [Candidatus Gottesmanbacteria bacterium GW2011_GWA2_43_14]